MSNVNPKINGAYDSPQSIYEASSVKNHRLGTRGTLTDGRAFYYARSTGAAITRATLLRSPAEDTIGITTSVTLSTAAAIGDLSVGITLGAGSVAAGRFEDGDFCVIDGAAGIGQSRRVGYHVSATNSTLLTVTLDAPLEEVIATSDEVSLVANPFADVIITSGSAIEPVVGVSNVSVGAGSTTAQYFWCQTWGRTMVMSDASSYTTAGLVTYASSTTSNAGEITMIVATASTATVTPRVTVGTVASLGDSGSDGDCRLIDLKLRA